MSTTMAVSPRHAQALLISTLLGRLPHCAMPILLVVVVRASDGGYRWAALLASLYSLAAVLGHALLERLVDELGQAVPVAAGGVLAAVCALALAIPGAATASTGTLLLVLAAGLSAPPLEATMRSLWSAATGDDAISVAYAVDSVSHDLTGLLAPLLATALIPAGGSVALLVLAALGATGALTAAGTPPTRSWRTLGERRVRTAVRAPGVLALLTGLTGIGAALGALVVGAARTGEQQHAVWLAGALPAALFLGALLGSLYYGSRRWRTPLGKQVSVCYMVGFLAWVPASHATTDPYTLTAAVVVAGVPLGAAQACTLRALHHLAPRGALASAYRAVPAALGIGQALGSAAGGLVPDLTALPAQAVLLAAALTLFARRALARPSPAAPTPTSTPRRSA